MKCRGILLFLTVTALIARCVLFILQKVPLCIRFSLSLDSDIVLDAEELLPLEWAAVVACMAKA